MAFAVLLAGTRLAARPFVADMSIRIGHNGAAGVAQSWLLCLLVRMTTQRNSFQLVLFAFTIAVACAVAWAITTSTDPAPSPARDGGGAAKVDPSITTIGDSTQRVQIFLTSNALAQKLDSRSPELSGRMAGAAAARRAARARPRSGSITERRVAAAMDEQRNEALREIRRLSRPDVAQSERVASHIVHAGGEIIRATPLPNAITALVPARAVLALAALGDVASIEPSVAPILMSSPIDGSETWHAAGFTGQGASADGFGGPDGAMLDTGSRSTHQAFRSRLPGDSPTGLGSGPSRTTSPPSRSDFSGTKHGNAIAATIAATDLTNSSRKGLAYGIDKFYDPYEANDDLTWLLGITYQSQPGVSDLPEVLSYSQGIYQDTIGVNTGWRNVDNIVEKLGVAWTISAGNCGIATPSFTNCGDGPHRVSTPANGYNGVAVGGLDTTVDPYNANTWTVWPNSSPGPTWDGRKKPDLIAPPTPGATTPSQLDDTGFAGGVGEGTSFASPQAAAGALLLASVGVYAPIAQKAILVNSTTPIQGQTYWNPRAGWGALNLDGAFYGRANYQLGSVTSAGDNAVRFYRQTGVALGDRTTLVWNVRVSGTIFGTGAYQPLTNLDLSQVSQASGANTASGGSDAADTVDTSQSVTADNPMPGSGTDGGDNVEQTRSTSTGTMIYKVKALSAIAAASSEPFAIAGSKPITALQTPIPSVDVSASETVSQPNQPITVTAQISNSSADLALDSASATLSLPSGVSLVSGTLSQSLGTLGVSGSTSAVWQVQGTSDGLKELSVSVAGTTYSEPFSGTDSASVTIDGGAPTMSVSGPGEWSTSAAPIFNWSSDETAGVTYDVEVSRDGGAWTPLLTDTTDTSVAAPGSEGQNVAVRVRGEDAASNVSAWASASTTIDAEVPSITFGASSSARLGSLSVAVTASNVGSPVSARYAFTPGTPQLVPLLSSVVTYTNNATAAVSANLTVEVVDALGRTVRQSRAYSVPSSWQKVAISLSRVKSARRTAKISGRISTRAAGVLTIKVARKGKKGTRRVVKRVRPRSGRFSVSVRLQPGKYAVTVSRPSSTGLLAATRSARFTVR